MNKKTLKIFIIIMIAIVSASLMTGFYQEKACALGKEINYKNYGVRYDNVGFTLTPIDKTKMEKKDVTAALHLLDVVNKNLANADYFAFCSTGYGTARSSLMSMSGSLDYGVIYIKDGKSMYYQSAADVVEFNSSAGSRLSNLTQGLLDRAERKYSPDGKTFYVQKVKGNKAKIKVLNKYPFSDADYNVGETQKLSLNEFKKQEYVAANVNELTNMLFTKDTILDKSVAINYSGGIYRLAFTVDLSNNTLRDKATKYARGMLRDLVESNDLEFNHFRVNLEVWDNGLVRKFTREESWKGTINLPLNLKPEGISKSSAAIWYNWNPADCKIKDNKIDLSWAK